MDATQKSWALGSALLIAPPAIAGTSASFVMPEIAGPCFVAAVCGGAITAFIAANVCRRQNKELMLRLSAVEATLDAYVYEREQENESSHSAAHVAAGEPHCNLLAIIAAREAMEQMSEESESVVMEESPVEILEFSPDVVLEQAALSAKIKDAFTKDPLENVEDEIENEAKAHGIHSAVELPYDAEEAEVEDAPYDDAVYSYDEYEEVANEYAKNERFKKRMFSRSRGVKSLLAERLAPDSFSDVPVIQRADGTVGDVGTTWWDEAVAEQGFNNQAGFGASQARVYDSAEAKAPMHSANQIAARVADPRYESPAPELVHRLRVQADSWLQALEALESQYKDNAFVADPIFSDIVGEADTLDEPEGLEQDTNFLTFRAPAGHPEVQDTNSYIDFLVIDEFGERKATYAATAKAHLQAMDEDHKKAM